MRLVEGGLILLCDCFETTTEEGKDLASIILTIRRLLFKDTRWMVWVVCGSVLGYLSRCRSWGHSLFHFTETLIEWIACSNGQKN